MRTNCALHFFVVGVLPSAHLRVPHFPSVGSAGCFCFPLEAPPPSTFSIIVFAPVSVTFGVVVIRATNEKNKIAAAVDAVLSDDKGAANTLQSTPAVADGPVAATSPSSAAALSEEEAKKAEILKSIDE